jgi:hypothetical protein
MTATLSLQDTSGAAPSSEPSRPFANIPDWFSGASSQQLALQQIVMARRIELESELGRCNQYAIEKEGGGRKRPHGAPATPWAQSAHVERVTPAHVRQWTKMMAFEIHRTRYQAATNGYLAVEFHFKR